MTQPHHAFLPLLTLINSPHGETIARDLSLAHPSTQVLSFATPLREAFFATFFQSTPVEPTTDILHRSLFKNISRPDFLTDYRLFLEAKYGHDILAKIAINTIAEDASFNAHFIIDDATFLNSDLVRATLDLFEEPESVLILNLGTTQPLTINSCFSLTLDLPTDFPSFYARLSDLLTNEFAPDPTA